MFFIADLGGRTKILSFNAFFPTIQVIEMCKKELFTPHDTPLEIARKCIIQRLIPDGYLESSTGTSKNIFYDTGFPAPLSTVREISKNFIFKKYWGE